MSELPGVGRRNFTIYSEEGPTFGSHRHRISSSTPQGRVSEERQSQSLSFLLQMVPDPEEGKENKCCSLTAPTQPI